MVQKAPGRLNSAWVGTSERCEPGYFAAEQCSSGAMFFRCAVLALMMLYS